MGKRNKEPQVGRRRPMIQLGNARKSVGVVSRKSEQSEEPAVVPEKNNEASPAKNEMDDELAGFLAEINSLEVPSDNFTSSTIPYTNTITNVSNESSVDENAKAVAATFYDPTTFDPSTQGHLLPDPWEACYDENTGYYYYWNRISNEVQWFPPVVAVPPPPPPPPPPNENDIEQITEELRPPLSPVIEEETKDYVDSIDKEIEQVDTLECKEGLPEQISSPPISPVNANIPDEENNAETKAETAVNDFIADIVSQDFEDDEKVVDEEKDKEKEKDKELMNQIKEKIRRKKEEKLLKEREESDNIKQKQQEKEDMLREKLIKKKLEREKKDTEEGSLSREKDNNINIKPDLDTSEMLFESKSEEDFSLDMFAEELNDVPLKESKKEYPPTPPKVAEKVEKTDLNEKKVLEEVNPKEIQENRPPAQQPVQENKGSWRIVDSVYDEENSDSEEEKSQSEMLEEKSSEEMEDYANMLLEDCITENEPPRKNKRHKKTLIVPTPPTEDPPTEDPPLPPADFLPPLPPEDEPLPAPPEMTVEEEETSGIEIGTLSEEIFEKLNFLGISSADLRSLQIYLIEVETRLKDWKAGALNTKYFLKSLKELSQKIIQHEEDAAPPGWLCHWSSEFKMYYYYNSATGDSQWEYPEVPPAPPVVDDSPVPPEPSVSDDLIEPVVPVDKAPLVSPAHGFSRDPVQTNTVYKKKKRPVKEESPDIEDPYRDPYRQVKRTKKDYNDDDLSGSPSVLPEGVIAAAPQIVRQRESSPVVSYNPSLPQEDSSDGIQSPLRRQREEKSSAANKSKLKKKRKPEAANTGLLPNKKLKHVSSLVQKWQTVKQQVEEEENVELESEDENYEQASERRIEEWKKEIETSGMKEANPNFTEIKGNWRERLLKRKT